MTPSQKDAWFTLGVLAVTTAVLVGLYPLLGSRSLGALGLMGLMGLKPLFYRRREGQVITDERDAQIRQRSFVLATALFWVCFVLTAVVLAPLYYGGNGSVPVPVVQLGVWAGWVVLASVESVAILVQYRRGYADGQ